MKKWWLLSFLLYISCVDKKPLDVVLLLRSSHEEDNFYQLMEQGVRQQLELLTESQAEISVRYLLEDKDDSALKNELVERQVKAFEETLTTETDAIIFTPEDEQQLPELLNRATEQGIVTVSLLGAVEGVSAYVDVSVDLQEAVPELYAKVSDDDIKMMVAGSSNIPFYNNLSQNFIATMNKVLPSASSISSNYDFGPVLFRSRAYTFNFLAIAPNVKLNFALTDHVARANMSAFQDREAQVYQLSIGGSLALIEQARAYPYTIGLFQLDPQHMGAAAAQLAYALVHKPSKVNSNVELLTLPFISSSDLEGNNGWEKPFPKKGYKLSKK